MPNVWQPWLRDFLSRSQPEIGAVRSDPGPVPKVWQSQLPSRKVPAGCILATQLLLHGINGTRSALVGEVYLKRFVSDCRMVGPVDRFHQSFLEIRRFNKTVRNHAFFWKRRGGLTSVKQPVTECQMN